MAHFAEIDTNNIVTRVLVVSNEKLIDKEGYESENNGIIFLKNLFGEDTRWIQTSYNNNFRGNYAGIGYFYNESQDEFIYPV